MTKCLCKKKDTTEQCEKCGKSCDVGYQCIDYAEDCRGKKFGEVNFCCESAGCFDYGTPSKTEHKGHEFVRLSPESGDWEAWYMDGKLIAEGHSVRVQDILDEISSVFPNTYKLIEISDEKADEGFSESLEEVLK
jgi:hypothetical protein